MNNDYDYIVIIEKIFRALRYQIDKRKVEDHMGWKCIPRGVNTVIKWAEIAQKYLKRYNVTIMDLGCGYGTGLIPFYLVFRYRAKYYGIDFRKNYKIFFEGIFGLDTFIMGNIRTMDYEKLFKQYEPDIIYLYTPLRNEDKMCKLEAKILTIFNGMIIGSNYGGEYMKNKYITPEISSKWKHLKSNENIIIRR